MDHSITTRALLFCFIVLTCPHLHAHGKLQQTLEDADDRAGVSDAINSEDFLPGREAQLKNLERHKRNALNDENFWNYLLKDGSEKLLAEETTDYENFGRVRRGVDEDDLGEKFEIADNKDVENRKDSFTRMRRSVGGDEDRAFNEDHEEDTLVQESSGEDQSRNAERFKRSFQEDQSEELDSAEEDEEENSEERIKRSISEADEQDDNEDQFRLKRDVDSEDLFLNYFNPKTNIRIKREYSDSEDGSDSMDNSAVTSAASHHRQKRSHVFQDEQDHPLSDSGFAEEEIDQFGETVELRTRARRSAKNKKHAAGGAHQMSSYTAYELKPAATSHKGKSGSGGGSSGHKSGYSAASGHKSGEGHKAGKGFSVDSKGSHDKKGSKGHKEAGGKKYAGEEHKSHSFKDGHSGKKGSKSHTKGHSAHKSKGQKQGGFKNKKAKDESGGSKSFYDKSDHKGYHSKYDHYDSFHVSSEGGETEKGSHASKKTHDIHGASGHKKAGKHHDDKAAHKDEHGSKGSHNHKKTSDDKASHDSKHVAKH